MIVNPIENHEGKKYLRKISPALRGPEQKPILVDVYCVLEAFGVTCQATGHAIKKLLCPGQRGKGDRLADLIGAKAALERAIEQEQDRLAELGEVKEKETKHSRDSDTNRKIRCSWCGGYFNRETYKCRACIIAVHEQGIPIEDASQTKSCGKEAFEGGPRCELPSGHDGMCRITKG